MLRVTNLEAGYGKLRILKGVSLHVNPGEIVILLGANGAGKTTLLKAVCGILRPQGGQILFEGMNLGAASMERVVEQGCVLVPEGRQLFGPMSVRENLLLGGYLHARRGRQERVRQGLEEVFQLFPRLAERRRQWGNTLSGGEQQMLAVGRALMSRARLLLLDEPSMGLAPLLVQEIFRVIQRINQQGAAILLVEQNAHLALEVAHRAYILETGEIALSGPASELRHHPQVLAAYLGGA